jgi:hypothetical protein
MGASMNAHSLVGRGTWLAAVTGLMMAGVAWSRASAAQSSARAAPDASAVCVPGGLGLTVTGGSARAVEAHTTVVYRVAVTDQDVGPCGGRFVVLETGAIPAGFRVAFDTATVSLGAGQTATFVASVTGTTDAPAGNYSLPFEALDIFGGPSATATLPYDLLAEEGCFVRPNRELFISDTSVVDDPVRTSGALGSDPRAGAWSFGRLAAQAAPSEADGPELVERLLETWLTDQTINGLTVSARRSVATLVLDAWPRTADGALDLAQAPLRLLAIVNRMDQRGEQAGPAGQARFVFGVLHDGVQQPFTVIFEYRLPAESERDVGAWAEAWHRLGALPFPSEAYNAALQAVTDRFVRRGAAPRRVNGSALSTLRTNENALQDPWELRQFELASGGGWLQEVPVDLTPATAFTTDNPVTASFINQHQRAIIDDSYTIPLRFEGAPFRGGSAINQLDVWNAPGIRSPAARHELALNACNGCHASETLTGFLHVSPRDPGTPSVLSGFITGVAVPDPVTGELRVFNELGKRKVDLESLACGSCKPGEACFRVGPSAQRTH